MDRPKVKYWCALAALLSTCRPQTQNAGSHGARLRLSLQCAVAPSVSRKLAIAMSFRRKNSLPGSGGSRITASLVCGSRACKSTTMPHGRDRQSCSTEHQIQTSKEGMRCRDLLENSG